MTAFGRARSITDDGSLDITAEVKSVNSRYLECTVKIPRMYSPLEDRIKSFLAENGVVRGKVEVSVSIDVLRQAGLEIAIDEGVAGSYIAALEKLRDTFGLKDDITVSRVAQNKDLFIMRKPEDDIEKDWENIRPVLAEAVSAFNAMRKAEGERLCTDILAKAASLREMAEEVRKQSEANTEGYPAKLEARIRQLLDSFDVEISEQRILTEAAIFADKIAIDEEIVRLGSHFTALEQIIGTEDAAGKKLDFLVQEINREINTIGSKSGDTKIAHTVVNMKNELEKIREQIQNLE